MLKKILFSAFCLLSTPLFAQVQLVSSNPANGAVAVDQDSIVLEFNQPVMVDPEAPEWSGFFFFLEPDSAIQYNGIALSDDLTKVIIYVDLNSDTDYLMGIGGIKSVSGESLDTPYLIQFTTYAEAGKYTVTGTVPEGKNGVSVFLSMNPFGFDPGFEEDSAETEDFVPVYGAVIDTTTGEYVISGIRENTYFPVGFNLFQVLEEGAESDFFFPDIYIYDPNGDLVEDSIEVNATTTTNDTLSGIDLTKLDISPFTFSEAVSKAQNTIDELDNDPVLIGGTTFYFSIEYSEDEPQFEKRRNLSFSSSKFELPSFKIAKPGLFGTEKNSFFKATAMEDETFFFDSPDGTHMLWEVYLYDAVKDSALTIYVTPFGNFFEGYFSAEDVDLPEGVQFSDIKPMPDTYIDSDAAVDIFLTEGISDLIAEYTEFGPSELGGWFFDITGLHLFWEYAPNSTPEAPVMWVGTFEGFKYNYETESYSEHWVTIFLDIQTGEVLHIEEDSYVDDNTPILFSDAYTIVQEELAGFANNPVILGGGTYYYNEYYFKSKPKQLSQQKHERSSQPVFMEHSMKSKSSADPDSGFQFIPNGYQTEWDVFAYDTAIDSIIYFYVNASGVQYFEYLGTDDAEIPGDYSVADLKPIPETYIDSDSAAAIIEAEGGEAFRTQYSVNNETEYSSWEMDLTALHYFWEYPDDPTPTAPVMWVGQYYGDYYNYETEESLYGYLIVVLDIETGEVLYSESESDSIAFTPMLFSEALVLAEEVLTELDNSPVMVGGSTYWYYQPEDAFKNRPKALTDKINSRAKQRMAKTSMQSYSTDPDGYQIDWEFYGYDAVKDSALGIYVFSEEAEFFGYIGLEEADLPEGVTFDSIKPLPESFIDSDAAVAIIEAEGGAEFREKYGFVTDDGFGYWDMWLDALHAYWDYAPDPTPNAPVMWAGYYYGFTYDYQTEEYTEDSMAVFIDIQTGEVLHSTATSSETLSDIPTEIKLMQNYPNPFNPSTIIPFELNKNSHVQITVYNMLGQKVTTLANSTFPAGTHALNWNASGHASGVYFYRLEAGDVVQTRKLMLLK